MSKNCALRWDRFARLLLGYDWANWHRTSGIHNAVGLVNYNSQLLTTELRLSADREQRQAGGYPPTGERR